MNRYIVLDSGPPGLIINPKGSAEALRCNEWLRSILSEGSIVVVPEIADYEVRRELIRANRTNALRNLDLLKSTVTYLPITTRAMLRAADLWAEARKKGKPTADDKALDGDVILAAQTFLLNEDGKEAIVATENVDHLSLFVKAQSWKEIG